MPITVRRYVLVCLACVLPLTGCHVDVQKSTTGGREDKNVQVSMPFGGVSVKTDAPDTLATLGLTPYPGATLLKTDKDSSAADVNVSFGAFHVGVKVAGYQTPDAPDKVMAFYRKDLARYGTVIACKDNRPVGEPTHTAEGLGCEKGGHNAGDISADGTTELKAGSRRHQHVVSFRPKDGGTHFSLVMLDLPSGFDFDASSDSDDKQ